MRLIDGVRRFDRCCDRWAMLAYEKDKGYWVECRSCGRTGPTCQTEQEAGEAWHHLLATEAPNA